jgi:hypothetical protein
MRTVSTSCDHAGGAGQDLRRTCNAETVGSSPTAGSSCENQRNKGRRRRNIGITSLIHFSQPLGAQQDCKCYSLTVRQKTVLARIEVDQDVRDRVYRKGSYDS